MELADWLRCARRPTYAIPSCRHQTLLSLALFEHAQSLAAIAAVAATSKTIQNSSLAANFCYNLSVDSSTSPLFLIAFGPSAVFSIQFVPRLTLQFLGSEDPQSKLVNFFFELKNTRYFHKSLQGLKLAFVPPGYVTCLLHPADRASVAGRTFDGLRTLELHRIRLSKDDVELLNNDVKLPTLKSVRLSPFPDISDEELALCAGIKKLVSLDLDSCEGLTDDGVSYAIAHMISPKKITTLSLKRCFELSDYCLKYIGKLENLTTLSLSHLFRMTDEALKYTAELEHLTSLNICSFRKATNDGMREVAKLANLTELFFPECRYVDDETITKHFSKLTNLTFIDMSLCKKISEVGLLQLFENNGKIRRLVMSPAQAGKFRKIIPWNVQVIEKKPENVVLRSSIQDRADG